MIVDDVPKGISRRDWDAGRFLYAPYRYVIDEKGKEVKILEYNEKSLINALEKNDQSTFKTAIDRFVWLHNKMAYIAGLLDRALRLWQQKLQNEPYYPFPTVLKQEAYSLDERGRIAEIKTERGRCWCRMSSGQGQCSPDGRMCCLFKSSWGPGRSFCTRMSSAGQ